MVHEGVLPCHISQILQLSKRQNAKTAWQNAFVDHLLDFGLGKTQTQIALPKRFYYCTVQCFSEIVLASFGSLINESGGKKPLILVVLVVCVCVCVCGQGRVGQLCM
jgi:hypothetical protein